MAPEDFVRMVIELFQQSPPDLFLLKKVMLDFKVAGEWVLYNDTEESSKHRVSKPGTWVRMTSVARYFPSHSSAAVVHVRRKEKRYEPHPGDDVYEHDADDLDFYDDHRMWKKYERAREEHPFEWVVGQGFQQSVELRGSAPTLEEAKARADARLREEGWVLCNPDLIRLAEAIHPTTGE
jgi:hypothetical protein